MGGGGGLFYWSKNGNSREEGGGLHEIPSVEGVWIFSGTTHCAKVMQTYFAKIHGFSWLFNEKISNFRWTRIFNEKSR